MKRYFEDRIGLIFGIRVIGKITLMLIFLCVAFACGDDPKDVVDVKFDPNSTYRFRLWG